MYHIVLHAVVSAEQVSKLGYENWIHSFLCYTIDDWRRLLTQGGSIS